MPDTIIETGSSVKGFVNSFLSGLEEGLKEKGYTTCKEAQAHAKMELNALAVSESGGDGGARIMGLGASLQVNNSNTNSQKITVFVKKINDVDAENDKAEINMAKAKQRHAEAVVLKGLA